MTPVIAPTIDISPFFNGRITEREHVAKKLDQACRETGFFAITGHGINEDILQKTRKEVVKFFALPIDE